MRLERAAVLVVGVAEGAHESSDQALLALHQVVERAHHTLGYRETMY